MKQDKLYIYSNKYQKRKLIKEELNKMEKAKDIQTILTNNMFTELKVINWQLEGLPASKQKEVILKTTNNMLDEILYLQKGF